MSNSNDWLEPLTRLARQWDAEANVSVSDKSCSFPVLDVSFSGVGHAEMSAGFAKVAKSEGVASHTHSLFGRSYTRVTVYVDRRANPEQMDLVDQTLAPDVPRA